MNETCGDNRFEIIEQCKNRLIEATNIDSRPEEMAVLDSLLFRMWQMGWLPGCESRAERTCNAVMPLNMCSVCGEPLDDGVFRFNYCAYCGAKVVR